MCWFGVVREGGEHLRPLGAARVQGDGVRAGLGTGAGVEGFGYSGRCGMKVAAAPLLSRSLASCVELVGENRASPGTWYQENDRERGV